MTGLLDHKSVNGDPQVTCKQPVSKRSYTYFDTYAVLLWEINGDYSGDTVKLKKTSSFSTGPCNKEHPFTYTIMYYHRLIIL
jgi:hypothetical protein